jgi:hypothetical protein
MFVCTRTKCVCVVQRQLVRMCHLLTRHATRHATPCHTTPRHATPLVLSRSLYHTCDVMPVVLRLWCHACGVTPVLSRLCCHVCDVMSVTSCMWYHACGVMPVASCDHVAGGGAALVADFRAALVPSEPRCASILIWLTLCEFPRLRSRLFLVSNQPGPATRYFQNRVSHN